MEQHLSSAMGSIGYNRSGKLIYTACWGRSVEHFLYFKIQDTENRSISADFGFRNISSEDFSVHCVRAYGGILYDALVHESVTDCKMRFSLGRLANWDSRWSLKSPTGFSLEFSNRVKTDIERYLPHNINIIRNKNDLLRTLLSDAEPWPWIRVNGAIRAAQIIYLLLRSDIGKSPQDALEPFRNYISMSLTRGFDVEEYINKVALLAKYPLN